MVCYIGRQGAGVFFGWGKGFDCYTVVAFHVFARGWVLILHFFGCWITKGVMVTCLEMKASGGRLLRRRGSRVRHCTSGRSVGISG